MLSWRVKVLKRYGLSAKKCLIALLISTQTAKPIPPEIIKAIKSRLSSGLRTKGFKLSPPRLSKPALQKAETARKIALKIPCPSPNLGIKSMRNSAAIKLSIIKVIAIG